MSGGQRRGEPRPPRRTHLPTPAPGEVSKRRGAQGSSAPKPMEERDVSVTGNLWRPKSKEKVLCEKLPGALRSSLGWEKFGQSSFAAGGRARGSGGGRRGRGTGYQRGAKGMKASHPRRAHSLGSSAHLRSPLGAARVQRAGRVGAGSGCLSAGRASEPRGLTAGARAGGSARARGRAAAPGERCALRASLRATVARRALHHPFYRPPAGGVPVYSGLPVPG